MDLTYINWTGDTFTPTQSQSISTWVWEMCKVAQEEDGLEPLVISREATAESYPWPNLVLLKYPWLPSFRGSGIGRLLKMQQKWMGWGHPRQQTYVRRVARELEKLGVQNSAIVLHNDPEMAVLLRRHFPQIFIHLHIHCETICLEPIRSQVSKSVDLATAVSSYIANYNKQYFGFDKVDTLYNGCDTKLYFPEDMELPGKVVINYCGRIQDTKGVDILLLAACKLAQLTQDFEIQILGDMSENGGDSSYRKRIKELAADLEKLGISVRMPGFVSRADVPKELRKASVHVVPSRWDEPCALALFEGMAAGLATVASRTGGTPEVVGDGGQLFERDDVEGLANILAELVGSRESRRYWQKLARNRAEHFTWSRTWNGLKASLTHQWECKSSRVCG